jgi:hypothetical protein
MRNIETRSLQSSFIAIVGKRCVDLAHIVGQMGHRDPRTVVRYIRRATALKGLGRRGLVERLCFPRGGI